MANRVLLLLAMASRSDPHSSSKILSETAGWFLFLSMYSWVMIPFPLTLCECCLLMNCLKFFNEY